MGNVSEGTVYLFLDANFFDEENTEARWNGHCELGDGSHFEDGPEFVDAGEAVAWWRRRGATRIYIRLDFEETLWAGEGAPPIDAAKIGTFEFADHRGRPEGAKETLANMRRDFAERQASEDEASALEEGQRLTRRRESVDISIDQLAKRVGVSSHWLADIEAGTSTDEVTFSQWVDLVWATRRGWPDEKRATSTGPHGWVARRGQFLREAEKHVNNRLGLYDGMSSFNMPLRARHRR